MTFVNKCGIPRTLKSDNAPEFKGKNFMKELDRLKVETAHTEPMHPNENTAERRGGMLKAAVVHLLTVTGCPLKFWCYAIEFMAIVKAHTARGALGWRTPYELMFGTLQTF